MSVEENTALKAGVGGTTYFFCSETCVREFLAPTVELRKLRIPIAAGALIPFFGVGIYSFLPFLAGAAMAFSSVTVVGNSLLLSRFAPRL